MKAPRATLVPSFHTHHPFQTHHRKLEHPKYIYIFKILVFLSSFFVHGTFSEWVDPGRIDPGRIDPAGWINPAHANKRARKLTKRNPVNAQPYSLYRRVPEAVGDKIPSSRLVVPRDEARSFRQETWSFGSGNRSTSVERCNNGHFAARRLSRPYAPTAPLRSNRKVSTHRKSKSHTTSGAAQQTKKRKKTLGQSKATAPEHSSIQRDAPLQHTLPNHALPNHALPNHALPNREKSAVHKKTPPQKSIHRYFDLPLHIWFLSTTIVAWGGLEILKYTAGPKYCRWCDRDERGYSTLNRLDRQMRTTLQVPHRAKKHFSRASDVLSFALIPLGSGGVAAILANDASGKGTFWRRFIEHSIILGEAAAVSSLLYQIIALSAARQRPHAHFAVAPRGEPWNNISFCSGHTALAFSLVTAAGTIAYFEDSRWQGAIWALGLPAALATGAFRMAADQHYFTDVLAGAVLGALVGFAVPTLAWWLSLRPSANVSSSGGTVGLSGQF
jgi:membrane-associated phospholipid phosphatase